MALLLPGSAGAQSSDAQAAALLGEIQAAARELNYQGVFTYHINDQMQSYRITHRVDDGAEHERLETLDNRVREFIRHDDTVLCLMPDRKVVLTQARKRARFPALLLGEPEDFVGHYDVVVDKDMSRIAGRPCQNLDLVPRDDLRSRLRICKDLDTGLLLKAQIFDENGMVSQQVSFTQVNVGHEISDTELQPSWVTDAWKKVEQKRVPFDFGEQGWHYEAPPGYQVAHQTSMTFPDGREVAHLLLTDGLASISVFLEPYRDELAQHHAPRARQSGSNRLISKQLGDYWVVVVGDVPEKSLLWVADSLSRTQP